MATKADIRLTDRPNVYAAQSSRDPNLWHHVEINPETGAGVCSCPGDGSIARAGTVSRCRHVKAVFKMVKKDDAHDGNGGAPAAGAVAVRPYAPPAVVTPAPSTAVVPFMPTRDELRSYMELANFLQGASMLPKGITKSQDVLMLLLYGRQLGIDPMTASQKLFVIDGKIGMYAEMMLALAKANDPTLEARFEWSDADGGSCSCDLWRKGKSVQKVTYTAKMADAAGQTRKAGPWNTYRRDMLAWNACKRALRLGAPDLYLAVQPRGVAAQVQELEENIYEGSATVVEIEPEALPSPAAATTAETRQPAAAGRDPGPKPAPAATTASLPETAPESPRTAEGVNALRDLLKRAASELPEATWAALRAALNSSYKYALTVADPDSGTRYFRAAELTPEDLGEAIADVTRMLDEAKAAGAAEGVVDPDDLPFE